VTFGFVGRSKAFLLNSRRSALGMAFSVNVAQLRGNVRALGSVAVDTGLGRYGTPQGLSRVRLRETLLETCEVLLGDVTAFQRSVN